MWVLGFKLKSLRLQTKHLACAISQTNSSGPVCLSDYDFSCSLPEMTQETDLKFLELIKTSTGVGTHWWFVYTTALILILIPLLWEDFKPKTHGTYGPVSKYSLKAREMVHLIRWLPEFDPPELK